MSLGLPLGPEAAQCHPQRQGEGGICLSTELPSSLEIILIVLCCCLSVVFLNSVVLVYVKKMEHKTNQKTKINEAKRVT